MTEGLRVEVAVACPSHCPVAAASVDVDGGIDHVSRAVVDGQRLDEYRVPRGAEAVGTPVFETDDEVVYRTTQPCELGCPCERLEAAGCPPTSVRAVDGELVIAFHAPDRATVRQVVATLDEAFDVELRRLVAGERRTRRTDTTVVDRTRLTDRQREVVETAYRMGYFEYPREASAETVATRLGVSSSAFAETLRAAERAVLDEFLPSRDPVQPA
ncbi:helix-turn-helix domain-containing protein [Salinigranum halophilum]|jgi:hypothetical protein|uniref:helix-turn-helix domain-containing protein n=1 Tax=Salinigranum halophilum TaxID=2565931 RepID=UPI00115DF315|nr:helix-turn-helix domain-containing protein [Salinigranum halophilum]